VVQATEIYTDDEDVANIARLVSIPTIALAKLALPPESAQGQLP
jgi:hypothetical protein